MFRKYARIVFLAVFALLSSGVVATLHMCQSEIKGFEWFSGESKKCPCNKKDMQKGCCDTLVIHYDQEAATQPSQPAVPTDSIIGEMTPVFEIEQAQADDFHSSSLGMQAREPVPIVPIWLINQSLRIPDAC